MLNELPDIFSTQVISADIDVFWQQVSDTALEAKNTLVISEPYGPGSEEEQQLVKMLSACKLSPDKYTVVKLAPGENRAWFRLRPELQPSIVLLLGVHPAQLGISALMRPHDINPFDGARFVPTASLAELLTNAALKQHLWTNVFRVLYTP
ncbi:MAG: hypothetical protein JNL13_11995 [Chitinophagaceae bacterium]|nr:hypothetical protein [Chitinophagaceae bacterium]